MGIGCWLAGFFLRLRLWLVIMVQVLLFMVWVRDFWVRDVEIMEEDRGCYGANVMKKSILSTYV